MSDLYAIGYPNLVAAEQVVDTIAQLQAQHAIQVDDAVIVERRGRDKVKLHRAGSGKTGWAGLIGHVFPAPMHDPAIQQSAKTSRAIWALNSMLGMSRWSCSSRQ